MATVSKQIENNFKAGLKTEFTGLNFPPDAATQSSNTVYSLIGDVTRRGGINFELNNGTAVTNRTNSAMSTYKWNNVGGDGLTQIVATQIGSSLYFYRSSSATLTNPLSQQLLGSIVSISAYTASGGSFDATLECQFSDGNGYLFVFHPSCDPFYCSYSNGLITANLITIQTRDFTGFYPEPGNPSTTFRPPTLTPEHKYNLLNQGWTAAPAWTGSATTAGGTNLSGLGTISLTVPLNSQTWTIQTGVAVGLNQTVSITMSGNFTYNTGGAGNANLFVILTGTGTVTAYNAGNGQITITVTSFQTNTLQANQSWITPNGLVSWTISSTAEDSTISSWNAGPVSVGGYPSNADIWYLFKDATNKFNPATTIVGVGLPTTQAPLGHFVVNAFSQQFSNLSGIAGLTSITTNVRPRTGAWFQGRVWYTGVDASQTQTGDQNYYTWTERIYFSQIVTNTNQFGYCYQVNDPTDEHFFDLLPSDGGVIFIQGSGSIYKLFPVQNGLLVFAANGIWFITGSTGIGFAANDYTITKISGVQSIASTSFVNVLGWPIFWNHEGIYEVAPAKQGASMMVENLCLGTILSFYNNIPFASKKYVRGDYDPISFVVQWCYRSTNESSVTDRYQFDSMLNINWATKAFYPYNISTSTNFPYVHDVRFVVSPGGTNTPDPILKYYTSVASAGSYNFTFSEENDFTNYVDWKTFDGTGLNFISSFTTGFSLNPQKHPYFNYFGQALVRYGMSYVTVFTRNETNNAYKIQGIWDFAISGNSGKISSEQVITNNLTSKNFGMIFRRHRIRGRGHSLQFNFSSVDGMPFDIIGWSTFQSQQEGP